LSRSTAAKSSLTAAHASTAGFTLIEALVALAVVAASLSSIGALIATTIGGTRSIERHLTELEAARTIETALPAREQLVPGSFSGETAGHRWRVDVSPFNAINLAARKPTWEPQTVVVTVQSPSGGVLQINTIRLRRRGGE
jgi:general secretion pathway protein I